ncbi:hypothetical protein SYNPS1DRAFT_25009 [Syncephalis pseudoplumigaleata]|uniref:Uncharacterized protein n=1 Tax=Syncephalis pseudoplumigaleata TaxID=1712513 RepID=A0A4P9YTH8_9FUNG|nr:hypothetical protein SYNPS1DRAFT_25009 [Syncephalis pseudoplumigaleata]|eukprot:RKP23028.1 hypothetical protein SYNPS1DRAFT_25009 [Syncephalis pseudoplumigaleata]
MKLLHLLAPLAALSMAVCIQAVPADSQNAATASSSKQPFEVAEKLKTVNFVGYFSQPDSLFQNVSSTLIAEAARNVTQHGWSAAPLQPPRDFGTFVVSRKEFELLAKVGITGDELYQIGSFYYMAYTMFDIECLGRTRTQNQEIWYLKVNSGTWKAVRKHIAGVYQEKLKKNGKDGQPDAFNPDDFYPHITLGQTGHECIKDVEIARGPNSECVADVKMVGMPF